ncbi:hypothetical protein ACEUZ9_002684 [Paracoccus litorisediminis]|uniref:hypothetical protein n=1 Tax=Paracoccus litorisediminis TaxID=2006130 RepID=UPI003733C76D
MIDRAALISIIAERFGLPVQTFTRICALEHAHLSPYPPSGIMTRDDLRAMAGTDDPTDMRAMFAVRMHRAAHDLEFMLNDLAARAVVIDQGMAEAVAEALAPIFEVSHVRPH